MVLIVGHVRVRVWLIVITIIIVVDSEQFSGGASKEKGVQLCRGSGKFPKVLGKVFSAIRPNSNSIGDLFETEAATHGSNRSFT